MANRNPLDRNISLRLPVELLHQLENKIEAVNKSRADRRNQFEDMPPANLSDCIRKMCDIGLAVLDEDPVRVDNYLGPMVERRLHEILASGYHNKGARALLEQIAKAAKPEPWE